MRSLLGLSLLVACSSSSSPPAPDGAAVHTCTSSREQTADPACATSASFVATFASYHPSAGAVDGVPAASFPVPAPSTQRPAVELGHCGDIIDATPACVCDADSYCYPDGTCHATPYATDHDVGAIELAVDGAIVGTLSFDGTHYAADGDLATRVAPVWTTGQHVTASNAMFTVDGIAPAVPDVTTFAHTADAQILPAHQDLALAWSAGSSDDVVEIMIGTALIYVPCVASDTGTFTIPWPLIQGIYDRGAGELYVFVDRVHRASADSPLGRVDLIMRASDSQQLAFVH